MAVPVVASVGTGANGSGSSIVTNAPSGVTAGDLLELNITLTPASVTITTPTGWNSIGPATDGTSLRTGKFWRIADGTADDTPTVTLSGAAAGYRSYILRVTGASATQPHTSNTGTGSNATPLVPSVTTTLSDCLNLTSMGTIAPFSSATPSTWTNKVAFNSGVPPAFSINSKDAASAGSYGGESYTTSASNVWAGITAAYRADSSSISIQVSDKIAYLEEAISRSLNIFRVVTDKVALVDVPSRGLLLLRTITDKVAYFEENAPLRSLISGRTISDKIAYRDTPTRSLAVFRAISDLIAIAESIRLASAIPRTLSEKIGLTDTVDRSATLLRALSELIAIVDTPDRSLNTLRSLSDKLGIRDTPNRTAILLRALSDTVAIRDTPLRSLLAFRAILDAVAIGEHIDRSTGANITITDKIGISELSVGRACLYARNCIDAVALSDTVERRAILLRSLTDLIAVIDTATRSTTANRRIVDLIAIQDVATLAMIVSRLVRDRIGIHDNGATISGVPVRKLLDGPFYRPQARPVESEFDASADDEVE